MKRIALIVGALVLTFAAGVAVGMRSVSIATSINPGLVNALNSVGQNLFGFEVFGARIHPPGPNLPAVQMDVVAHPPDPVNNIVPFPKIINVAHPPDPTFPPSPCTVGMQVVLGSDDFVTAIVNPVVVADGLLTVTEGRPTGAFCEAVPPVDG